MLKMSIRSGGRGASNVRGAQGWFPRKCVMLLTPYKAEASLSPFPWTRPAIHFPSCQTQATANDLLLSYLQEVVNMKIPVKLLVCGFPWRVKQKASDMTPPTSGRGGGGGAGRIHVCMAQWTRASLAKPAEQRSPVDSVTCRRERPFLLHPAEGQPSNRSGRSDHVPRGLHCQNVENLRPCPPRRRLRPSEDLRSYVLKDKDTGSPSVQSANREGWEGTTADKPGPVETLLGMHALASFQGQGCSAQPDSPPDPRCSIWQEL